MASAEEESMPLTADHQRMVVTVIVNVDAPDESEAALYSQLPASHSFTFECPATARMSINLQTRKLKKSSQSNRGNVTGESHNDDSMCADQSLSSTMSKESSVTVDSFSMPSPTPDDALSPFKPPLSSPLPLVKSSAVSATMMSGISQKPTLLGITPVASATSGLDKNPATLSAGRRPVAHNTHTRSSEARHTGSRSSDNSADMPGIPTKFARVVANQLFAPTTSVPTPKKLAKSSDMVLPGQSKPEKSIAVATSLSAPSELRGKRPSGGMHELSKKESHTSASEKRVIIGTAERTSTSSHKRDQPIGRSRESTLKASAVKSVPGASSSGDDKAGHPRRTLLAAVPITNASDAIHKTNSGHGNSPTLTEDLMQPVVRIKRDIMTISNQVESLAEIKDIVKRNSAGDHHSDQGGIASISPSCLDDPTVPGDSLAQEDLPTISFVKRRRKSNAQSESLLGGKLSCDPCSRNFNSRQALQVHLISSKAHAQTSEIGKVDTSQPLSCKTCDKLFISPQALRLHRTSYKHIQNESLMNKFGESESSSNNLLVTPQSTEARSHDELVDSKISGTVEHSDVTDTREVAVPDKHMKALKKNASSSRSSEVSKNVERESSGSFISDNKVKLSKNGSASATSKTSSSPESAKSAKNIQPPLEESVNPYLEKSRKFTGITESADTKVLRKKKKKKKRSEKLSASHSSVTSKGVRPNNENMCIPDSNLSPKIKSDIRSTSSQQAVAKSLSGADGKHRSPKKNADVRETQSPDLEDRKTGLSMGKCKVDSGLDGSENVSRGENKDGPTTSTPRSESRHMLDLFRDLSNTNVCSPVARVMPEASLSVHPDDETSAFESISGKVKSESMSLDSQDPDTEVPKPLAAGRDEKRTCLHCMLRFKSAEVYRRHLQLHTGDRKYQCDRCNRGYNVKQQLSEHYRSHTGETPYVCKVCARRFQRRIYLVSHMRVHQDGRKHRIPSVVHKSLTKPIGKMGKPKLEPGKELDEVAPQQNNIKCNKPDTEVDNVSSTNDNIQTQESESSVKGETDSLQCEVCERQFTSPKSLRCHVTWHSRTALVPEQRFNCNLCQAEFRCKQNLERHMASLKHQQRLLAGPSTGDSGIPFSLDAGADSSANKAEDAVSSTGQLVPKVAHESESDSSFIQDGNANELPAPSSYMCNTCWCVFPDRWQLAQHSKRTGHDSGMFNCSRCSKSYPTAEQLQHHSKTHVIGKPYTCRDCGKPFKTRHYLNVHRSQQHGSKVSGK